MRRALGWMCYRIVMAWPIPLPDCRESRTFSWILARAGRHANKTPNGQALGARSVPLDAPVGREED